MSENPVTDLIGMFATSAIGMWTDAARQVDRLDRIVGWFRLHL